MSSNYVCRPAESADYSRVIDLWMSGISSDRIAIEQAANSWWKRLLFRYIAGRKIFIQDMETHVVEGPEGICGYIGLQTAAETVNVFDWGLDLDWTSEGHAAFQVMLDAILDHVYEMDDIESFVVGLETSSDHVRNALQAQDFELLNYQVSQLVCELPLPVNQPKEGIALSLSPKVSHSYASEIDDWIRSDYGGDASISDIVIPIHHSLPSRAQLFEVKLDDVPIGYVQSSSHRAEGRFLYALSQEHWGQDVEKLLITAFCTQLARTRTKVRVRTFSLEHMHASREALESLGMKWELSPWERWAHLLFETEEDEAENDAG